MNKDTCKIPVQATYKIVDGEPELISANYIDIPSDDIAKFLIQKFGLTPISSSDKNGK